MALIPRNINLPESLSAPEWSEFRLWSIYSPQWWKEHNFSHQEHEIRFECRPCPSIPKETAHKAYLYDTMQFALPFLLEKEFHSFWPAGRGIDAHSSVI